MLKIPKSLITRCADEQIIRKGKVNQVEIQKAIAQVLNRELTRREKARITQVLRRRYIIYETVIDSKTKRRILYFE